MYPDYGGMAGLGASAARTGTLAVEEETEKLMRIPVVSGVNLLGVKLGPLE